MPIFLYFKMKHKATKPSKILEIQYWKILTQTWFHHFQMFIMNIVMELFKMDHMVSEFFCTSFCFQIWLLVVLSTWNFFPCRSKVRSFHASNIRIGRPIFVLKDHLLKNMCREQQRFLNEFFFFHISIRLSAWCPKSMVQ